MSNLTEEQMIKSKILSAVDELDFEWRTAIEIVLAKYRARNMIAERMVADLRLPEKSKDGWLSKRNTYLECIAELESTL